MDLLYSLLLSRDGIVHIYPMGICAQGPRERAGSDLQFYLCYPPGSPSTRRMARIYHVMDDLFGSRPSDNGHHPYAGLQEAYDILAGREW